MRFFLFLFVASLFWEPSGAWALKKPASIYAEASPSVALLLSYESSQSSRAKGTGSLIAPGLILTNAHVVMDGAKVYPYTMAYFKKEDMNDGQANNLSGGIYAKILHLDRDLDLALLQLQSDPERPLIALANAGSVHIGDPVLAIGHPENGGLWSLTSGRIGSKIRNFEKVPGKNVFQTEASLNRGNSGGPLLDENGLLIGVNTSVSRRAEDGFTITGINFALTSNVAHKWLQSKGVEIPFQPAESSAATENASPTPKPQPKTVLSPATPSQPKPQNSPKKSAQGLVEKSPAKKEPQPKNRLLTPKRPFRDDQLFESTMSELEQAMEAHFHKKEDDMDALMDKAFDSF